MLVISAFNQYSTYAKVNVFNEMAISYSNTIRENLDVDKDGVNDIEIRYYDGDNYEVITSITPEHDLEKIAYYTVKSGDEALTVESQIKTLAKDAAAEKYFELSKQQKFLWVNNIWIEDLPWKKAFINEGSYSSIFSYTKGCSCKANVIESSINVEGVYKEITGSPKLNEVKDKPNGYLILVVLSIGSMVLSQLIMNKSQKAQLELQSVDQTAAQTNKMMQWMMPIMFGIFSFMYTASFSIYLIVSTLFSMFATRYIEKIVSKKFEKAIAREEEEKFNKRYAHLIKKKDK